MKTEDEDFFFNFLFYETWIGEVLPFWADAIGTGISRHEIICSTVTKLQLINGGLQKESFANRKRQTIRQTDNEKDKIKGKTGRQTKRARKTDRYTEGTHGR